MSYVKQNFTKGQTLKAEHLNYIEEGIVANTCNAASIIDATSIIPNNLYFGSNHKASEVASWLRSPVRDMPQIYRFIIGEENVTIYSYTGQEVIPTDSDKYNVRIFFGDDLCPLILDVENEKIILDPDWVAPGVEVPITHCAFIKQNNEIMTGNIETFEEACKLLSNGANRFHATIAITTMEGDYLESETCHAISVRSRTNLATGATNSIVFYFESCHSGPFQVVWNSDGSLVETEY